MGDEDLKTADDLRERNRAILLPRLHGLSVINEDYEVILFALVMDFGLRCIPTRHDYWSRGA